MLVLHEAGDALVDLLVLVARRLALPADDERRPRLVDEDRVDLVDDGVVQLALTVVERAELHVVAQVIEAELVVLAVGDVGPVGGLLVVLSLRMHDHADAQAEEVVEAPHPLGVALRQVVVDGDDVDALAFEGVEVAGQRGDEGLALAGAHLGDGPAVQDHSADELHVVVAHLERALPALAADGECFVRDVVEGGAAVELFLELGGLRLELRVAQRGDPSLEGVDGLDARPEAPDLPFVRGSEHLLERPGKHGSRNGLVPPGPRRQLKSVGRRRFGGAGARGLGPGPQNQHVD